MDRWHETLKTHLLKKPPPGHKSISWTQLENANRALWQQISVECEGGCKADHTDPSGLTNFEISLRKAMKDPEIRAHLHFLQGGPTSATPAADVMKLQNRIQNLEEQLRGQKRRATEHYDQGKGKGKGGKGKNNDKGKGKNKNRRGNDYGRDRSSKPAAFGDLPGKTPAGEPLCFNSTSCRDAPMLNPAKSVIGDGTCVPDATNRTH